MTTIIPSQRGPFIRAEASRKRLPLVFNRSSHFFLKVISCEGQGFVCLFGRSLLYLFVWSHHSELHFSSVPALRVILSPLQYIPPLIPSAFTGPFHNVLSFPPLSYLSTPFPNRPLSQIKNASPLRSLFLRLTTFPARCFPPYAILFHCLSLNEDGKLL